MRGCGHVGVHKWNTWGCRMPAAPSDARASPLRSVRSMDNCSLLSTIPFWMATWQMLCFNDFLACCLVNGSMMTAAGQSSFQEAPYRIWLHRHEVVNTRARATQRPLYIIVVIVIVIVIVTSSVGVKFCCVGQLPAAQAARQQASLKRISSLATWWV